MITNVPDQQPLNSIAFVHPYCRGRGPIVLFCEAFAHLFGHTSVGNNFYRVPALAVLRRLSGIPSWCVYDDACLFSFAKIGPHQQVFASSLMSLTAPHQAVKGSTFELAYTASWYP